MDGVFADKLADFSFFGLQLMGAIWLGANLQHGGKYGYSLFLILSDKNIALVLRLIIGKFSKKSILAEAHILVCFCFLKFPGC